MKKSEKDELLEKVLGKDAKRRVFSVNEAKEFVYDSSLKKQTDTTTEVLEDMLKKQNEQIKSLISESSLSDADLDALQAEIKKDFGVAFSNDAKITKSSKSNLYMTNEDFEKIRENVNKVCIGQKDMVNELTMAFRKPFISENGNDKPLFSICICGDPGTGKHLAVKTLLQECAENGFFNGYQYISIKMDNYVTLEDEKNFAQDIYMALQTDSSVIVFENIDKCSTVFAPMLEEIVNKHQLSLKKRYIFKDNQLIETNSSLVTSAINHLSFVKKGIVMIADCSRVKLTSKLGKEFFSSFDSIIESKSFENEDLKMITIGLLENLKKQCLALNFEVSFDDSVNDFLIGEFKKDVGIESILNEISLWESSLIKFKLKSMLETKTSLMISVKDNRLVVNYDDKIIYLDDYFDKGEVNELNSVISEMNEIVGLDQIKDYVLSLKDFYEIQRLRTSQGLKVGNVSKHMIFTGNPGTGKTTIARIISKYLRAINVLSSGQLVEVTRADLVGKYVGHTAPLTTQVIKSALGGVLFIDEAYSLYRGKDDSFGLEAIDTIVKGMEDYRDNLIVILAGYSFEMEEFLTSNSGLKSRFPNIMEFPDYSGQELLDITKSIVKSKEYRLDKECEKPLLKYFENVQLHHSKDAGNGRLARNMVEAAILKQSTRVLSAKKDELDLIKLVDFDLSQYV